MSLTAVILLLVSAAIHASWNLLTKRSRATLSFFLIAVVVSILVFFPIPWIFRRWLHQIPPSVWILLASTAVFQALYYFGLASAYRSGELSLVYPLVRALPVLLVAGVSWLLGRGSQITAVGLVGMLLVALGCFILPLKNFSSPPLQNHFRVPSHSPVLLFAILAAVGTTGYTIIDDIALKTLRGLPEFSHQGPQITFLYTYLETVSITLWLALMVILIPAERREIKSLPKKAWISAAFTGVFILLAYGIVLVSMAYVRDVSYVSAFRQISIPLGALIGLLVEKENAYRPKVVGIFLISIGLVLVALG